MSTLKDVKDRKKNSKRNRLILTENVSLKLDGKTDLNTLVVDGSGSRALSSFIEPNLCDMPHDTSFVIADPGGAIWKATHEKMEAAGYDIVHFDPYDIEGSFKFAPLNYCFNEKKAANIADSIFNETENDMSATEGFFDRYERILLAAVITYMQGNCGNTDTRQMKHIAGYINDYTDAAERVKFDRYYESCKKADVGREFRKYHDMMARCDENTLKQVACGLLMRLSYLGHDGFQELTSDDHCKVYTQFNTDTVIYICFGAQHQTYDFLSRMLLAECIREVRKRVDECGKRAYHVRFILNGLQDIGDIRKELPDFFSLISTAEAYGMSFQMIVQSLEQIRHIYGSDPMDAIMDMSNILAFGTGNDLTARYISERTKRATDTFLFARRAEDDIVTPGDILHMAPECALVLMKGRKPVMDTRFTLGTASDRNEITLACVDAGCAEPTKKIAGRTCCPCNIDHLAQAGKGPIESRYTYTCRYLKAHEPCPYSHRTS